MQGKKDLFYLMTVNTFYLQLYGIRHVVKDHKDNEGGNSLPSYGLFFPISSKVSFMCTDRITHTTAFFYTSYGSLVGTRNSSMGPP